VEVSITYGWRDAFDNGELNALHDEAFDGQPFDEAWDWNRVLRRQSLGWVVAREEGRLVGFVNVVWDGMVHAWLQDVMVAAVARHRGIATQLVATAVGRASAAGCEWLHVDFDESLRPFYIDACGFAPATAGLLALSETNGSNRSTGR
jgi:GNAT superfamily N-acetyltransferase